MFTLEGVKCVCKDAFYGEKCQFQGKMTNCPFTLLPSKEEFNTDATLKTTFVQKTNALKMFTVSKCSFN
jgi:hypothetical protein